MGRECIVVVVVVVPPYVHSSRSFIAPLLKLCHSFPRDHGGLLTATGVMPSILAPTVQQTG